MRVETDKFIMEWAIPERVLHITYKTALQRDDLVEVAQQMERFYEQGQAPVHVISDHTDMPSVDADLGSLRETFKVFSRDKWGWMMLIGTNNLLNFFAVILERFFRIQIRHADSPEDALLSLQRLDQTLSDEETA